MITQDFLQEKFGIVQSAFSRAEQYLKEDELIGCGLLVPAVNQLRYAGAHVLRSLLSEDARCAEEHLDKALNHCHRAIFDALDVRIQFYVIEFTDFEEHYRDIVVSTIIPEYSGDVLFIDDVRSSISVQRRDDEDYGQLWQQLEFFTVRLKDIHSRWTSARHELNKVLRKDRRDACRFWTNIIIAVTIGVLSVCAAVISRT